jgi:glycosyltransferase involved in cell wall biosynthesis
MKILLINSEYPPVGGGAGNASANLARCLQWLGHNVTVLTAGTADLPAYEVQDAVSIHRIRGIRRWVDRSSAFEQGLFVLFASIRALRFVQRSRPDAVLAFFGMPCGAAAWLLKKLYGIPYVVSLRGGDVPGFRPYDFRIFHKLIGPFLHMIWRDAAAVVANSRGLQDLARAFDPKVSIPIISNGVEVSYYDGGPRPWSSASLLSVGRVVYQKGFDLGLQALYQLKELDWQWRIAGDGPQMASLKALARELGISDRVIFLGWQARDELVKCYHASTIFLFPSRHEGMPNAVLEAMASGLPVVATRIAGNEELVLDDQTGLLAEPESVSSLRDNLRLLLADPSLRQRMGDAALARVKQAYSWESSALQYSRILEEAIR